MKSRLAHVSGCSTLCCLKTLCLPIYSWNTRVSYQLNYFWIKCVFVARYFCTPALIPGMIIAIEPVRLNQRNCSCAQPQMQRQDSRGWKLWASWWDWEQPGVGGGKRRGWLKTCLYVELCLQKSEMLPQARLTITTDNQPALALDRLAEAICSCWLD